MDSTIGFRNAVCCALIVGASAFSTSAFAATQQLLQGVQHSDAGDLSTCAVVNGGAQCWGDNSRGQLGDGTTVSSGAPVFVHGLRYGISAIAAGSDVSCAVDKGAAKCWGGNGNGQLGIGTTSYSNPLPVAVSGLGSGVTRIAAGSSFVCAVVNGGAQCWGYNAFGQLGIGGFADSPSPAPVSNLSANVSDIAPGSRHTCAIASGGVQCWGNNSDGELGNGSNADSTVPVAVSGLGSGVSAVAVGGGFSCAVASGAAQCWGNDSEGQLGNGGFSPSTTPVPVLGLSANVIGIAAGRSHGCALVGNDLAHPVKCWGNNASGQLGNGSANQSYSPVDVVFFPPLSVNDSVTAVTASGSHSCAQVNRGGALGMTCWGDNEHGELGVAGPPVLNPAPTSVLGATAGVTAISAGTGAAHVCAAINGAAECWGSNVSGELGNGIYADSSVAQPVVGLSAGTSALAAGFYHTCAVVSGAAQCWGDNSDGELGNGSFAPSGTAVPVTGLQANVTAIAAAGGYIFSPFGHSCAIVNGGAKCWGDNADGQLGNGSTANSNVPVNVIGLSSGVSALAAGGATGFLGQVAHTCAVANGGVQCWGNGTFGELGNGGGASSANPVVAFAASSGATDVSAGGLHSCAVVSGAAWCWGQNARGQLGTGNMSDSLVPVAVSGLSTGVTSISSGASHTCAVSGGAVRCWGDNSYGQLGDGSFNQSNLPVTVVGLSGTVTGIAAGFYHTCALLSSGAAQCWGSDQSGQMGDHRLLTVEAPQAVIAGNTIFVDGFDET